MARGHSTVRYLKLEYSVLDPLPLSRLSILTLPTAATRPWIVSGKRLDENGSTCRSPDHLTPITSESPNVFAAVPRCQVTKISPTPLRHVELVKFDPYGPVNAGNALGGANRQGTGVSEAAWLVKINECDSFMWVSGFPLSIHSFSSTDCISKQRHNIVSEGEQDRPFPSLLHHYLRTVGQLCALDSYL